VTYEARFRPPQPATPAPGEFTVHRSAVRDGLSLAYVREGVGGHPLLLLHGYPETKRIWWRNIAPLAAAGFEVIAPDLRGYGDSDLSPDDVYDLAVYSRDVHALVHDVLGHRRCAVAGGDIGGVVGVDLVHRFDDFVERLCFFNTVPPAALEQYAAAGMDYGSLSALSDGPTGDYRELQGARPDELAAMLPTPDARRQWVAGMYQSRLWASPGTFGRADVDFMTEPFADEDRLRAGWSAYQLGHGRPMTEPPLLAGTVDVPTLLLYGTDDHVVGEDFVWFSERAFTDRIGPLLIPGAGHFLQWERADIFNPLLVSVFGDLR
jgi:pimeloyl-ACP methyl ester carboxylesterase